MNARRYHWMAAAGLLAATALVGAVARGKAGNAVVTGGEGTTVTAPTKGSVSFRGHLDRTAVLLGHDGQVRMELVIGAAPDSNVRATRRPTDVVIVLDRSGSMSGDKMEHARAAVRELLGQLGPQDRFGLVTYSDGAALSIPMSPVGEPNRAHWLGVLAEIEPNGGTNMASGLDLGLGLIERARSSERVPRLLLISDGLANQGDATHAGLVGRAKRAAGGEYTLSAIGVGVDFNEYLMTALADAGTGNYYYVREAGDLNTVLARELDAARSTVASALAVHITPAPGVQVVDAAGYPLEAGEGGVLFRPGSLFAGQERRIWVTLAVPQASVGEYDLGRFALSYGEGTERTTLSLADLPRIACVQGEDEFYRGVDVAAWGRSVVVDTYNRMREEVARDVKEGRRDQAIKKLVEFKDETATLNARLKSPEVDQQLHSVDQLVGEVSAAFVGANQAGRQNELSKAASAAAVDARRAGSKK